MFCTWLPIIAAFICNICVQPTQPQRTTQQPHYITVHATKSPNTCDKRFLSLTLDTHLFTMFAHKVDFSFIKLHNLASALAPCDLNIKGRIKDMLQLDNKTRKSSDQIKVQGYQIGGVKGVDLNDLKLLNHLRWNLILDLNGFRESNGVWNVSKAKKFLKTVPDISFYGFHLSYDPGMSADKYTFSVPAEQLVGDYKQLRDLISTFSQFRNSYLYGPSVRDLTENSQSLAYLHKFIKAGGAEVVDEVSLHYYYKDCSTVLLKNFLNVSVMDSLKNVLHLAKTITQGTSKELHMHLSETSMCTGVGRINLSDTFVSGFIWLNTLGTAAVSGLSRVFRQTFMGGFNGLVSDRTLNPRPDYYLSVFFKNLVEGAVFPVSMTPAHEHVRIYSNCARLDHFNYPPGALVIYYLNVGSEDVEILLTEFTSVSFHVFTFSSGDQRGLSSSSVKVNGKILEVIEDLPKVKPLYGRAHVTLDHFTYGFLVLPKAEMYNCISQHATESSSTGSLPVLSLPFPTYLGYKCSLVPDLWCKFTCAEVMFILLLLSIFHHLL